MPKVDRARKKNYEGCETKFICMTLLFSVFVTFYYEDEWSNSPVKLDTPSK